MRKSVLFISLVLLLFGLFGISALAAGGEPAEINGSNVRLRAENNTDSAILTTMSKGTAVTVLESAGEWYKIICGDKTGYVLGTYITFPLTVFPSVADAGINVATDEPDTVVHDEVGVINASDVRLRAENNTDSAILTTMRKGSVLAVLESAGDWYKVVFSNQTGYVLGTYVTFSGDTASPSVYGPRFNGNSTVDMVDWFSEGKSIMKTGTKAMVTDVATGISFQIRVMSSGSHADVEPLTAEDTAAILRSRSGKLSWTPRAILISVNGRTIAASCNGVPHGGSTIQNNDWSGHFCIHFLDSRNHYNNKVDAGHQRQVRIAYDAQF